MSGVRRARRWAIAWLAAGLLSYAETLLDPATSLAAVWPSTVERITKELASTDVAVQRQAAARLAELPASALRRLLPSLLVLADPEVRVDAGHAALRIGFDATREAEGWLQDSDPNVRRTAAEILGAFGVSAEAVTALARTLSDPIAAVRLEAAKALANAPAGEGTRVLLNHLDDAQEAFVLAVVDALAVLGDSSAVVPLVGKVQDPRVNVRRAVVRALGEFGDAGRVTVPLILALADSDAEVRRLAAGSVVAVGAVDAVQALEERVRRDRDVDVQVSALSALLDLQELVVDGAARARVFDLAVTLLSHERQELRSESLDGLSQHATLARKRLRECLANRVNEVVGACAVALGHDQNSDNVELMVAAWRQGRLDAQQLLSALQHAKGDQALLVVLELLSAPQTAVRDRAMEVAARLLDARGGDGRAVEPVADALRSAGAAEEAAVLLDLLGRTRSSRAVRYMLPYLEPTVPATLMVTGVTALGRIANAGIPPAVVTRLLTHEEGRVRSAAALAVRDGEWADALGPILSLLRRAQFDEAPGLALAIWGPARYIDESHEVASLIELAEGAEQRVRAPLMEALARVSWSLTAATWERWSRSSDCAVSSKVSELLEKFPRARPLLVRLTKHPCVATQANAAWALGGFDDEEAVQAVRSLVYHEDRAISGNAIAALGRVAARRGQSAAAFSELCLLVQQGTLGGNAHRAANALFALRVTRGRCGDGSDERNLLGFHERPEVRRQAARLLAAVPIAEQARDQRVLERCVRYDLDGDVATACSRALEATAVAETAVAADSEAPNAVSIFVVPPTRTRPLGRAPFTLITEQDAYRFGWTDARGGVWAWTTDAQGLRLGTPVGAW